ncbi:MAG: hypothetical protein ACLS4Z_12185 [Christensenellaceae bacterium]
MALSQMMRHYLDMKEKYKGCILFYRLGDFYEMFFEDAEKVSKLLDLTLTGKDCGLESARRCAGFPITRRTYISGWWPGRKVAIASSFPIPRKAKDLSTGRRARGSVGTLIDDAMLDETKNNIACLFKAGESIAAAWTDITTGEFSVAEFSGVSALEDTITQIVKLSVAEVICNEEMLLASKDVKEIRHNLLPAFSCYVPWAFNVKHAEKNLLEQFQTLSLAAYGIAGKENAIAAAGALVEYLRETQKHSLSNINSVKVVDHEQYMVLDSIAVRNLELVRSNAEGKKYGSLLWLIDKTRTGMPGLNRLKPPKDIENQRPQRRGRFLTPPMTMVFSDTPRGE